MEERLRRAAELYLDGIYDATSYHNERDAIRQRYNVTQKKKDDPAVAKVVWTTSNFVS